jgi:hypothetical protein
MADESQSTPVQLVPLPEDPENVPGRYASIDVSPEPIFGPEQLGSYKSAVEELTTSATRTDSSSRIFEILQAWEARLFSRGYQFLTTGNKGIGLYGGAGTATPSSIMATGNAMKLFPVNVYGAREDKITAALAREIPGLKFSPKDPDSPPDQTAADESDSYLKVWLMDSDIKGVVARICRYFYTDGRVVLWTRSVADQQRWGTETPDRDTTFGAGEDEGVSPETENQPGLEDETDQPGDETEELDGETGDEDDGTEDVLEPGEEGPAICEITTAHGILESKVPIYADDINEMGYVRLASEVDVDILKERYPWIEDKIVAGQSVAGSSDQYDRMARINVRLAVQTSTASGETFLKDATETHTWYRPSQYRAIKDKTVRKVFYTNFPKGLRVTHAGSELAFVRNEGMDDCLEIRHSKDGNGQNRRAIGSNYLPLQKILNQNISLLVRYFVACVPRRFGDAEALDIEAINSQSNDPGNITGVKLGPQQTIDSVTGIEKVPQPTTGLMEFVQWLVSGAPEVMDGATPTMFGNGDTGTVGEAQLNRDQSLQVFSAPWAQICGGLAKAATQAARSASRNRKTNIRSRTPGQNKLTVELANLQGDALCYAESLEIPQTLAEQEAQTAQLVEQSPNVAIYQAIVNDPLNLPFFAQMPSLSGLNIPGLDAVEKQQGEFELLTDSGPLDNPELQQVQEAIAKLTEIQQQGTNAPEAQTPEGQAMLQQVATQLQQLQQQSATLPPLVSSVPVAQDGSENHVIEAAVTLAMLNSPMGRKLKNGDQEQVAIFQNLKLHWQEHQAMAKKLTPVQPLPVKASASVAIDKLPPNVQAQALQAMGVEATPDDFTNADELVPHEVTVEKEGVDAQGVPVKQKISTVNPGGRLQ